MIQRFAFYLCFALIICSLLSACAAVPPTPRKIALLAPFEGQYREIGYEALYAAQMALQETQAHYVLLPLDDGGTETSARERAQAFTYDPSIAVVLALGPYATTPQVQAAYGTLPVLLVGYWPSIPQSKNIAALSADLRDTLPAIPDPYSYAEQEFGGAEILSLPQFDGRKGCVVWSSAQPADEAFTARYKAMNTFAPPPRLIAPLTYNAAKIAIIAIRDHTALRDVALNGISFDEAGYWREAAKYQYGCGASSS